jgi:hypothetical protein
MRGKIIFLRFIFFCLGVHHCTEGLAGSAEIRIRNLPYSCELRHTLISWCAAQQIKELGIRKYVELCSWKILCTSSLTNMKLANIKSKATSIHMELENEQYVL